ncbi:hypothetical protein RHGRI_007553 [Rhododendron griersonianum]|uniref:DUF4378 domain-containing protein n=1 Tax=Rhododendron griersonianum TaxID=479676 RepID=A0AAV6KX83_9ERIC|nr:hypothetical protein RHGRI_007553 [Rhododendron griersonianum]
MESKPRTPSVVARLMGFDESPAKQPVGKPRRVLSDNYLWKSASIGLLDRRPYHECRSFKGNYERGQVFMVFEVPQMQTVDRQRNQSIQGRNLNPSTTEVNESFVRNNSTDAEHLSMDEKFQYSIVSSHLLEKLDSDSNLLLKNHQKPNSLFTNNLHELQSGHVTVLKSSNDPYSRKSEISRKSVRTTSLRNVLRSLQKLENDSYSDTCKDLGIYYMCPLLKSRLELKDKAGLSPSRIIKDDKHHSPLEIVVLKPKLGKTKNAEMPSVSPIYGEGSLPHDRKHVEFFKPRHVDLHYRVGEGRNLAGDTELPGHNTCSDLLTDSRTTIKGNETSTNESEVAMPSCQSLFDWKYRCQAKYPPLSRSYFAKQAKKQILERWKMSKSCQEVGEAVKGTTLGQMLVTPFEGTRPENLNNKIDVSAMNNQLSQNDAGGDLVSPLGISSGDGWKECAERFTRSESLPAACITVVSPITRTRNPDELKNSPRENDLFGNSYENTTFPNSPVSSVASLSLETLDSQMVAFSETKNVELSTGTPEKLQLEQGACILSVEEENSSHVLDALVGQEMSIKSHDEALISSRCPALVEEFPMSSWEGYSPSPNSVLEPPFSEEISSDSDTFQVAGANLQDLRVQLQLLKSESEETNSEGHGMALSSDEESGDGIVDFSKESRELMGLFTAEESRDFSYVVDLLDESGFHGGDTHIGFEWWYSPGFPVNLSVFEILEKKYNYQTSWDISERRLLFDCVNLGLKEILQPCMDVLTWEKDLRKKLNLSREVIEEELWMFLVRWRKEVGKELSEKSLGTEIRWFELREDIDFIVGEIERFLFDELAAELACAESF